MNSFYTVRSEEQHTVVQFQTESLMNPLELERIGASLFRLVDEEGHRSLILDFSPVRYLSSQAIGVVLSLNKKLSQHKDGRLVLCGVGPQLLQLLKITRLDRILKIVNSQEDGVALK